ncbi:alpha/beta hydrolase [Thalassorhabdus alkalitolerans]|uniref:Alpha/beta hydrolase n=1 Tax=Thalassorhabdus alkalitolerans TaxID=2282697 RepID=A0ABW0YK44_9BACI
MALDPQSKDLLEQIKAAGRPPTHALTPAEARAETDFSSFSGEPEHVGKVENKLIPGPEGQIPIRIYTPVGEGPFPTLVYFHGGGWVAGDLDGVDVSCRLLTNRAHCIVISVDYRLAPEHKYPAAVEDAYAAVKWTAEQGPTIQADPEWIAVGGDSAGGNLAAVVSLMARDKQEVSLKFQMLISPVTHHAYTTKSYEENGDGYLLTKDTMKWCWDHYLNSPEEGREPYASPLLAEDLTGLPPALVVTAGYDPLRDEGRAYAERLKHAGVYVEEAHYDELMHGFFWMPGVIDQGKKSIEKAAVSLKQAFNK